MMNTLMTAATVFFIVATADYVYRLLSSIYWDFKSYLRERKWKLEADARREEMDKALNESAPATPVLI